MATGRGVPWKRGEVLDLLDIWSSDGNQKALRESHRNRDVFQEISDALSVRGHQRSAEECRTKTKALRQAYKKALSHNEKTGNSPATCPFFDILHRVLKGDFRVKRRRMSQSLPRERASSATPEEECVTLNLQTVQPEDENAETSSIGESNPLPDVQMSETEDAAVEQDLESEDIQEDRDGGRKQTNAREVAAKAPSFRDPDDIPPDTPLSELPPPSRLALREKKRRKVSAMQRVGEMMLRQSTRDHQRLIEASAPEHEQLMSVLTASQEKEMVTNTEISSIFRDTLSAISELTKSLTSNNVSVERALGGEGELHGDLQRQQLKETMLNNSEGMTKARYVSGNTLLHERPRDYPDSMVGQRLSWATRPVETTMTNMNWSNKKATDPPSFQGCLPGEAGHFNPFYFNKNKKGWSPWENDPEDCVGTHAWGDTPPDTQLARNNCKEFQFNHDVCVETDRCEIASNVDQTQGALFSLPRDTTQHKPFQLTEMEEESQSLLSPNVYFKKVSNVVDSKPKEGNDCSKNLDQQADHSIPRNDNVNRVTIPNCPSQKVPKVANKVITPKKAKKPITTCVDGASTSAAAGSPVERNNDANLLGRSKRIVKKKIIFSPKD